MWPCARLPPVRPFHHSAPVPSAAMPPIASCGVGLIQSLRIPLRFLIFCLWALPELGFGTRAILPTNARFRAACTTHSQAQSQAEHAFAFLGFRPRKQERFPVLLRATGAAFYVHTGLDLARSIHSLITDFSHATMRRSREPSRNRRSLITVCVTSCLQRTSLARPFISRRGPLGTRHCRSSGGRTARQATR